jgi:quinol monooxygenase YgiN
MSVYAVTERYVAPEHQTAYFELIRQIRDRWAADGGLLLNRIAVSVNDPARLIGIGRWRTIEALEAARQSISPEVLDAFRAIVRQGWGRWHIYRPIREIENFTLRPLLIGVDLLEVPPHEIDRFLDTNRAHQERVIQLPGVAASRLLQSVDDPTRLIGMTEFVDDQPRPAIHLLIDQTARAFPQVRGASFIGRIGSHWEPTIPSAPQTPAQPPIGRKIP